MIFESNGQTWLTVSVKIYDQNATVKGYTDESEMLVRFDDSGYAARLPSDWSFDDVLPGEPVSHWQVWEAIAGVKL